MIFHALIWLALLVSTAVARPNIVVIMADDQDDMGSVRQAMPAVQALANGGVTFRNAFAAQPVCGPNRAAFLTGQFPQHNNIRVNSESFLLFSRRERDSLGPWLQTAGYRTGFMGKYLNGYQFDVLHVPPGWNSWQAMPRPDYYNFDMNENGTLVYYDDVYSTDLMAAKANAFIREGGGPFFLLLTPMAPHSHGKKPAIPAPRHNGSMQYLPLPKRPNFNEADASDKPALVRMLDRLDRAALIELVEKFRKRRESLRAVDDLVEQVVATLKAEGVYDNTLIIYTSDNGFSEGSHRWIAKGVVYEESLRVPLIIHGAGVPAGHARDHLVSTVDVTAFILNLAGATPTAVIDGRSFAPVIEDHLAPWRSALFAQGFTRGVAWWAVRTARRIFVSYSTGEHELYDLNLDPHQLVNVADAPENSGTLAEMQATLAELRGCSGAGCWVN